MPSGKLTSMLISYLQHIFSDEELVTPMYLWNKDQKVSRIRISSVFVVNNETPLSSPYITVRRGSHNFLRVGIDDFIEGDNITLERKSAPLEGNVMFTVGARSSIEASNIAQFIAEYLQTERHGIIHKSGFLRNFKIIGVGEEVPKVVDSVVHRYEVSVPAFSSSMYISSRDYTAGDPFNMTEFLGYDKISDKSSCVLDANVLTDLNKTFGESYSYDYFLEPGKLYYANIDGTSYEIISILSDHSILLKDATFAPSTTKNYNIIWNTSGIHWIAKKENV